MTGLGSFGQPSLEGWRWGGQRSCLLSPSPVFHLLAFPPFRSARFREETLGEALGRASGTQLLRFPGLGEGGPRAEGE